MSPDWHGKQALKLEAEASLDLALEGKSPEVKARVRHLVMKRGIDPSDPVWELLIALDILRVLIEDGPHQWETCFQSFQDELEAWTSSHLQTLTALAQESEAIQQLAQDSEQMGAVMQTLTFQSETLSQQLQDSRDSLAQVLAAWEAVISQLARQQQERQALAAKQQEKLATLGKAIQQLNQRLDRPSFLQQTSWRGIVLAVAVAYTLVFSAISLTTLVLYLRDRPLLLEQIHQGSVDSDR